MQLFNFYAQDTDGNALSGASAYVYETNTSTTVTIYDVDGNEITNPITTSTNGLIEFRVKDGTYDVRVVSGSLDYRMPIMALDPTTGRYIEDSGVADAYVVTYDPAVISLDDGMTVRFKASNANTGASTLAVNGLTATPIIGLGHSVLQGGEIIAGSECIVIYSKSLASFVLVSSSGGALQVAAGTQTNHAINLGQFSYTHSSSSSSGYRKEPDGRIHMWGYCITSSLPTVSGGSWSVTLPTAFPKYMESAQATLAMGAAVSGSAVSVMDVGTPFTGTTDNMLPKASASSISGYVFNNYGASTKMFIRWDAWGY